MIAATEPTDARKIRDPLALALETVMSKDQILENYLNIAAFGHGAIYAAGQGVLQQRSPDLTLEEAALCRAAQGAELSFDPVTRRAGPWP